MNETLVILAAGMGSRYGGLKQVDTIGNNGESIIDFTIYDAIQAGFKNLILIIRKEHEEIFEKNLVSKIRPFINVEYAYQDLHDVPVGVQIPADRVKPLGTTHALLSIRNIIKGPFMICNADDYYGKEAFKTMFNFLSTSTNDYEYSMVGYEIQNTLSDNGSVTRGLCEKNDDDYLTSVVETKGIIKADNGVAVEGVGNINPLTPASMNFWGFKTTIIPLLKDKFDNEVAQGLKNDPLKYEALLPSHVGELMNEGKCKVKVLSSSDKWFGVTYKEDKPNVVKHFEDLKNEGLYPFDLWKK